MTRSTFSKRSPARFRRGRGRFSFSGGSRLRRLHVEPLEDRRLLSITVDTLMDEADGSITDGDISLRDAIAAAPAGETIDFSVTGTINLNLSLGELVVDKDLTIAGPGADVLTIDAGDGADGTFCTFDGIRVFRIDDGNDSNLVHVEISGLTLSGGDTAHDDFYGYGGAIFTAEDLLVTACSISNNAAGSGGGIHNWNGTLTVDSSTIAHNRGSGIVSQTQTWSPTEPLTSWTRIISSTISANSAATGGGVFNYTGLTQISFSTITANTAPNGSGVATAGFTDTRTEFYSTIVAGNVHSDVDRVEGSEPSSVASLGYNLIGTGNALDVFSPATHDLEGVDPLLGLLTDNGGPTMTHALLPGSPAIGAGDPTTVPGENGVPDHDQRGAPYGRAEGTIDIGAYERRHSLVVDTITDESDDDYSVGDLSLREAILQAYAIPDIDTITFALSLSGQAIILGGTEMVIADTLTIDASALNENVTIDADGASRIFSILAGNFATELRGLTLTGAVTANKGGAIYSANDGLLTLIDMDVYGNYTTGSDDDGGAIYMLSGPLEITGSRIHDNYTLSANSSGGAIVAWEGLTIDSSTIRNNHTVGSGSTGGAIYVRTGRLEITHSTVDGNWTSGSGADGGGIFVYAAAVVIANSTVSGNRTDGGAGDGGGIYVESPPEAVQIYQSTFSDNRANGSGGDGGAIVIINCGMYVTRSTLTENYAQATGGAVHQANSGGDFGVSIDHSIVAGNTAASYPDIMKDPSAASVLTVNWSLIGTGFPTNTGDNNEETDAPGLGPLADNGGPTWTHALLQGSPAIDAGNPAAIGDYDQRGEPYARVWDGDAVPGAVIDIGAFELQPPPGLVGDYNRDESVDAADYVMWRKLAGTDVTPNTGADGNGDGHVDESDCGVWRENFGEHLGPASGVNSQQSTAWAEPPGTVAAPAWRSGIVDDSTEPRRARFRAARNIVPANAELLDEALIAWLASRSIPDRHDAMAARTPFMRSHNERANTADELDPVLASAFASFAGLVGTRPSIGQALA
jgi:hypothetical protein